MHIDGELVLVLLAHPGRPNSWTCSRRPERSRSKVLSGDSMIIKTINLMFCQAKSLLPSC